MSSRRLVAVVALVLAVTGSARPSEAAKRYSAERFDVRLSIEAGGSMVVTETIRFSFGPDQFTYVYRELPKQRIDGLTVLSVEMDGVAFSPGKQPGQYESKKVENARRRITWHLSPVTRSTHEFTLVYRVEGVVQQADGADLLRWVLLPTKHEYAIGCSAVEVEYPDAADLVASPEFEPAASDAPAAVRPVRASRCGFASNDDWMVTLRFSPRSIATTAPDWQQRSMQTWKTAPLLLGLAGLLLFGGLVGFGMFAANHRASVTVDGVTEQRVPPDQLPVALAGALAGASAGTSWAGAIGTLLDLASRGIVRIKTPDHATWLNRRDFAVVLSNQARGLREHERTLLDILFTTRKGPRDSVRFSQLSRAFASNGWRRFAGAVTAELRQHGLVDASRERTKRGAVRAGLLLLVASVVGFGIAIPMVNRIGAFVLAVPGALLVSSVAGLIVGGSLTRLSDHGLRQARLWKAYRHHLVALSKGRRPGEPAASLESLLPLAAAFGVALAWAQRLDKQHALTVPAWLPALAQSDGSPSGGLLVEMLSTANTAGAHVDSSPAVAGAGATGAAGGGSSGAG